MTVKQKMVKRVYPLLMKLSSLKARVIQNENKILPPKSFYELQVSLNNGQTLNLESLRGKKILLVNTASNCGFTAQYKELQQLYEQYSNKLEIIGFPANDFKEQEKLNDEAIAAFCQVNYGVSFPLAKKSVVIKGEGQNEVYQWLDNEKWNGWNNQPPIWNFAKYLVDEKGVLTHYFDPSIAPLSAEVIGAIYK